MKKKILGDEMKEWIKKVPQEIYDKEIKNWIKSKKIKFQLNVRELYSKTSFKHIVFSA